jgi:hypothetical protein
MTRNLLILSFLALLTLQLVATEITYPYTCQPTDRLVQSCPEDYIGVCGLYDKNTVKCKKPPCGITAGNTCTACANESVEAVILGECEKHLSDTSSNESNSPTDTYTCKQEDRYKMCLQQYVGVCGFYDSSYTCEKEPCMKTYATQCDACSDDKILKVSTGKCVLESAVIRELSGESYYLSYFLVLCLVLLI